MTEQELAALLAASREPSSLEMLEAYSKERRERAAQALAYLKWKLQWDNHERELAAAGLSAQLALAKEQRARQTAILAQHQYYRQVRQHADSLWQQSLEKAATRINNLRSELQSVDAQILSREKEFRTVLTEKYGSDATVRQITDYTATMAALDLFERVVGDAGSLTNLDADTIMRIHMDPAINRTGGVARELAGFMQNQLDVAIELAKNPQIGDAAALSALQTKIQAKKKEYDAAFAGTASRIPTEELQWLTSRHRSAIADLDKRRGALREVVPEGDDTEAINKLAASILQNTNDVGELMTGQGNAGPGGGGGGGAPDDSNLLVVGYWGDGKPFRVRAEAYGGVGAGQVAPSIRATISEISAIDRFNRTKGTRALGYDETFISNNRPKPEAPPPTSPGVTPGGGPILENATTAPIDSRVFDVNGTAVKYQISPDGTTAYFRTKTGSYAIDLRSMSYFYKPAHSGQFVYQGDIQNPELLKKDPERVAALLLSGGEPTPWGTEAPPQEYALNVGLTPYEQEAIALGRFAITGRDENNADFTAFQKNLLALLNRPDALMRQGPDVEGEENLNQAWGPGALSANLMTEARALARARGGVDPSAVYAGMVQGVLEHPDFGKYYTTFSGMTPAVGNPDTVTRDKIERERRAWDRAWASGFRHLDPKLTALSPEERENLQLRNSTRGASGLGGGPGADRPRWGAGTGRMEESVLTYPRLGEQNPIPLYPFYDEGVLGLYDNEYLDI